MKLGESLAFLRRETVVNDCCIGFYQILDYLLTDTNSLKYCPRRKMFGASPTRQDSQPVDL